MNCDITKGLNKEYMKISKVEINDYKEIEPNQAVKYREYQLS